MSAAYASYQTWPLPSIVPPPYMFTSFPPNLKNEVTFWKINLNEFACQYTVSFVNWIYDWMSVFLLVSSYTKIVIALTDINVVQERQVKGSPDCVFESFFENSMPTIIARMKSAQDVCRVVCNTVVVTLDVADFITRWRRWWRDMWSLWMT